ncbi:Pentapeptide repeat-containing protein [Pseudomonas antarctica]|uniref:Pentapeptide repeat-containing protein n=1 Tax=Pseudomonas antarctica TaxID=219572 RepID=A0A1H0B4P6_9PSED|nr:hypothetical protein PSAN_56760 [Pseudomonas antarctica]SDN40333.1 Pentapeptide repeat-containing protein [Pseudomonas antarctica]
MSKRIYAWWDCLYTQKNIQLNPGNWDFTNNKGPTKFKFDAVTLEAHQKKIGQEKRISFWGINFDTCDFSGKFEHGQIKFSKCSFTKCDLGNGSVWSKAKFNDCKFVSCSFTLAEFKDCFFHECTWENTTFNGGTQLVNTLVSDACGLVNSGYTNLDGAVLDKEGVTAEYQVWRLDQSKAKLSRMLMQGGEHHGDDNAYYTGVKSYLTQAVKAGRSKARFNSVNGPKKKFNKVVGWVLSFELMILSLSGWLNGWGQSIAKPAIFGLAMTLIFAMGYAWEQSSIALGLVKAFDITFLIGYTKHSTLESCMGKQLLYAGNAFLGLWWYAIMVPVLVNRISRVM